MKLLSTAAQKRPAHQERRLGRDLGRRRKGRPQLGRAVTVARPPHPKELSNFANALNNMAIAAFIGTLPDIYRNSRKNESRHSRNSNTSENSWYYGDHWVYMFFEFLDANRRLGQPGRVRI